MKQKIVLIIAVGMGILAYVLTYVYLKNEHDAIYEDATRVSILAAKQDLPAGTVLSSQNIKTTEVFEAGLSRQVFQADRMRFVLGKTLRYPLRNDSPIDWVHVGANLDELSGLAPTIRSGMRAISIPVSGESAVSGLVRPNDNVDILGTFSFLDEANPGEMETVTFTVLQDVTVLATGQETARAELEISDSSRRRGSYNTVTIAVFPEEAELLAFAMNARGSLMLSLRKRHLGDGANTSDRFSNPAT
jgi:pilus assembly protein CpaB